MALAILLTVLLYRLLRDSRIGRAIVAVRMDRDAAALMGVDVKRINAITFGIGALMAGAAGALLSIIFPISPLNSGTFLGKAFVVCVLGGLAGYPSFATAAFFGLGAYASAILQVRGLPAVAAWGCAGLVAMLFAAFIGGAILHLRGHYFAIASLVVAEMLREIVNTTPNF